MQTGRAKGSTMSDKSSKADWQGVGESFTDFGRTLKGHASQAQEALKASSEPLAGVVGQVGTVLKTGMTKFDEAVTDPAVRAAARGATTKLLDAAKAQIGADKTPSAGTSADASPDTKPNSDTKPTPSTTTAHDPEATPEA